VRVEIQRLIKQAERDLDNARKVVQVGAHEIAAFTWQPLKSTSRPAGC
jgi:HEPN domain-containing protein